MFNGTPLTCHPAGGVADIAFSLDGGIFATCSVDKSIKVCVY